MMPGTSKPTTRPTTGQRVQRIGCVGFLNSKPLIEGLEGLADPVVKLDVPSALQAELLDGDVDVALCPVIDYYRTDQPLVAVPVGCIASDGPTKTVCLFSRTPIDRITQIHADTDSHTSVALVRVLMEECYGKCPQIVPFDALHEAAETGRPSDHEAMLLIGDKVVTNAPPQTAYPYQLDLGETWKRLTGLPFVFAVWQARAGRDLGALPELLDAQRKRNAERTDAIADRHAQSHGWDRDDARQYLGKVLSYAVGPREIEAIERFAKLCAKHGLIDRDKPLHLYDPSGPRPD